METIFIIMLIFMSLREGMIKMTLHQYLIKIHQRREYPYMLKVIIPHQFLMRIHQRKA